MTVVESDGDSISFERALNAAVRLIREGRLEDAGLRLVDIPLDAPRAIEVNAMLTSEFIKAQEFESAVTFGRRAWSAGDDNLARIIPLGWALRHAGHPEEAIDLYRRASVIDPSSVSLRRTLAGWMAQDGRLEEAAAVVAELERLEPDVVAHKALRARILRQSGSVDEAGAALRAVAEAEPDRREPWLHLLSFYQQNSQDALAADVAIALSSRWPDDVVVHRQASSLLSRLGRPREAVAYAQRAIAADPSDSAARRQLASALTVIGHHREALENAIAAVETNSRDPENHVFLASHYRRNGQIAEALHQLGIAVVIDPSRRLSLIHFIELLKMFGRLRESEAIRLKALEIFPGDPAFLESVDVEEAPIIASVAGSSTDVAADRIHSRRLQRRERDVARGRPFVAALRTERRVIWALLLREARLRYGHSRLGYAWAIIEPVTFLSILGAFMAYAKSNWSPLGTHYIIFHFTGIAAYLTFLNTANQVMLAARAQKSMLKLPMVELTDVFAARTILEFVKECVVCTIMLLVFGLVGYEWIPVDPLNIVLSLGSMSLLGAGVGMINAGVILKFGSWEKIWLAIGRSLYLLSGIFYLSGNVPDPYRSWLLWNPVMHGIDWFRSAFYIDYHPYYLSKAYVLVLAAIFILIGLALERILRAERMAQT